VVSEGTDRDSEVNRVPRHPTAVLIAELGHGSLDTGVLTLKYSFDSTESDQISLLLLSMVGSDRQRPPPPHFLQRLVEQGSRIRTLSIL
jgi:hypothetical protein